MTSPAALGGMEGAAGHIGVDEVRSTFKRFWSLAVENETGSGL